MSSCSIVLWGPFTLIACFQSGRRARPVRYSGMDNDDDDDEDDDNEAPATSAELLALDRVCPCLTRAATGMLGLPQL